MFCASICDILVEKLKFDLESMDPIPNPLNLKDSTNLEAFYVRLKL